MNQKGITIVGTGNVAKQLGYALMQNKVAIAGIWGRNKEKVALLAKELRTNSIDQLGSITQSTVIICVSDLSIKEIIEKLPHNNQIAYTSGSVKLETFPSEYTLGVFYPLQTISKERRIDFSNVPLLIEATNASFEEELLALAKKISNNVSLTDSEKRFQLHIAAVLVNNFTNHLYALAEDHLKEHQLSFDLLKPLILETAHKIEILSPKLAQTGPAIRNDTLIIAQHIAAIRDEKTKLIYTLMSESIQASNH